VQRFRRESVERQFAQDALVETRRPSGQTVTVPEASLRSFELIHTRFSSYEMLGMQEYASLYIGKIAKTCEEKP
jgi:hypothetical protein